MKTIIMAILGSITFVLGLVAFPQEVNAERTENWTEETVRLHNAIIDLGYEDYISASMISQCKTQHQNNTEADARRCVIWITAIGIAESDHCNRQIGNNCRGLLSNGSPIHFSSYDQAIEFWVERYYRFRWKHRTPQDFIKKSRYCVSDTHGGGYMCPNWIKNTGWVLNYFRGKEFI